MPHSIKVFDFPDYSSANPWQIHSIGLTGNENVVRATTWPPPPGITHLHIGWEDIFLHKATNPEHAERIASKLEQDLDSLLSNGIKIIWTVHNLTSHTSQFKRAEARIRNSLATAASIIHLMSKKHLSLLDSRAQTKCRIIPHPILDLRATLGGLISHKEATYFRYGAARNESHADVYEHLINEKSIIRLVSDSRLTRELDDGTNLLVKRRFSFKEEVIYGALSTFALFTRQPCLNSGVFSFYLGARLNIFHSKDAVRYLDYPSELEQFEISNFRDAIDILEFAKANDPDLSYEEFIRTRSPAAVRAAWWESIHEL